MKRLCVGKGSSSKQKQINARLETVPQALQGNAGKRRGSNSQLESPLPQPINDVLCFSKINLIQCTSDFVFHVLKKKKKKETRPLVTSAVFRNGALTLFCASFVFILMYTTCHSMAQLPVFLIFKFSQKAA